MSNYKPILAICAVVIALTSVAGLMQLTDDKHVPVTDAIRHQQAGWYGLGQFPDLEGDDREIGELFDSTLYFTSWTATGNSEKIVVGGGYVNDGSWISCGVEKQRHRFYIWDGTGDIKKGGDDGWKKLSDDQISDGVWTATIGSSDAIAPNYPQGFNFQLDGLYMDGATIRDEFQIKCYFGDWITMTTDEARLLQGDGDLTWSKDVYTVGVDEKATLSWFVPAVDSEVENRPVYKLFVTNENTGDVVYEEFLESKSGSVKIPITEDMSIEGGSNRLMARLWNDIFQKDVTHVPIRIEGGWRAPGDEDVDFRFPVLNSLSTDQGEYLEGDTVTLTIDATNGTYPISHYYILCEIEGTEVVNTETTSAIYPFQASLAGIVECEVTVYDVYGNPSQKKTVRVTSANALLKDFCDLHPTDPACVDAKPGLDWLESLIIGLLVAALLIFVAFLTWVMVQVPFLSDWRIMAAVIGSILLAGIIGIAMLAADYMKT